MAGNSYKLKFNLSDGTTQEVPFTAPQGPQGIQGVQGPQGLKGDKGDKGEKGDTGAKGEKGDTGATGATGAKGTDGTSVTVKSVNESTADGGSNVITFSDGKTITIKNGSKGSTGATGATGAKGEKGDTGATGATGAKGADGYTPVKGTDYWTAEDKEEINAESQSFIVEELAKRGQLKPEFANSVAECTDTSKLYVLPDGYIYAYFGEETETPDTAPDTTLTMTDSVRLDTTTGSESSHASYSASNYISIVDGYTYTLTRTAGTHHRYFSVKICYYDASKKFLSYADTSIITNDSDASADNTAVTATVSTVNGAAYFRLRVYNAGFPAEGVFTLTATSDSSGGSSDLKKSGWCSTDHAFIPADYEDRITTLETDGVNLKNRVRTLESSAGGEIVADYVITEANRVISEVMQKQTNRTITFLAISDMHNLESSANIKNGNLHAGQAAKLIADSIGLDFAAMLGDVSCGATFSTVPGQSSNDVIKANQYIADAFRGVDNFRTNGNHDPLTVLEDGVDGNLTQGQMYALIGRYNKNGKSYFYRDYEDKKVRVIMLNTVDENNSGGAGMTAAQLLWFAQSLDLSSKSNASDWQILILSHHPLDWNQYSWGTNLMNAANILAAYLEGSSVTFTEGGVSNSYNFSGKNSATIIGQIHGHLHNYKVDNIYSTLSGAIKPTSAKRIAIPNACSDRNNTYAYEDSENLNGIEYGEFQTDGTTPLTYSKTAGTAEDTAFCVVTIDLDKKKIYVHHYGAGYDREISY